MRFFHSTGTWIAKQRKLVAGLAAGIILAGGSAAVLAAIPDANGVIHACYGSNILTKRFYVIDNATQTCSNGDTALNWNQTGPQGPAGQNGAPGTPGAPGPQGPAGPAGTGGLLANLVGADFTNASLQYRQMSGLDLHTATFTGAYLTGADLHDSNMAGIKATDSTNFSKANLHGVDFSGATLTTATNSGKVLITFAGSNVQSANFAGANLTGRFSLAGDFRGANFTGATLKGNTIDTGGDFRGANLTGTTLQISFTGTNFAGQDFRNSTLLSGLAWSAGSDLSNTNFSGMSLTGISAYGSNLTNANFSNTTLSGVQISEHTNPAGATFANAHITDSFFTEVDLTNANLTGVTWVNTICPDLTNSDDNGNTCIGHLVP